MFTFLAKQGQESQVARLLTANFGKPKLKLYSGSRGQGVLVTLDSEASNRQIDRFLHSQNVPGSVQRKNKYKVVKITCNYDAIDAMYRGLIAVNEVFMAVVDGHFRKARLIYHDPGCDCCGGWHEIEYLE